jgi:hypothetical protein
VDWHPEVLAQDIPQRLLDPTPIRSGDSPISHSLNTSIVASSKASFMLWLASPNPVIPASVWTSKNTQSPR